MSMDDWLGLFLGLPSWPGIAPEGDRPRLGLLITGERAAETAEVPVDRAQEGLPRLNPGPRPPRSARPPAEPTCRAVSHESWRHDGRPRKLPPEIARGVEGLVALLGREHLAGLQPLSVFSPLGLDGHRAKRGTSCSRLATRSAASSTVTHGMARPSLSASVRMARGSTGGGFPGGSPHRDPGQRPVVLDPTPRRHVAG